MATIRKEQIVSGTIDSGFGSREGVIVRCFASDRICARGFSTAMSVYKPESGTPTHVHYVSEAMTILEGVARVVVNSRESTMSPYDCMHVPAGSAHLLTNIGTALLKIHSAYGSARPGSQFVEENVGSEVRAFGANQSETVLRFADCPVYVPEGEPHRFINESDGPMAMIWVYAGDEPDRQIIEAGYCSGELAWPEQFQKSDATGGEICVDR